MSFKKPVVLIVIDGLGVAAPGRGNAVTMARTKELDKLWPNNPHTFLEASGLHVGLPDKVFGNSEVGHMILGAGRVIHQELARINKAISSGEFYENEMLKSAIRFCKQTGGKLHLMGLLSTGKVHAAPEHFAACLEFAKREGLKEGQVVYHVFTDGRDSPPQSAVEQMIILGSKAKTLGVGVLGSFVGRYFAMDRDNRWDRTQKAYDMLVKSKGIKIKTDEFQAAIEKSYESDVTDEFLEPHVIYEGDKYVGKINSGDALIFLNYRADRAVQLSRAFADTNFKEFDLGGLKNLFFAGFSSYQKGMIFNPTALDIADFGNESNMVKTLFPEELSSTEIIFPPQQVFPPERLSAPLGKVISDAGMTQLRIAESEKFPHATYFLNARNQTQFPGEERIEVPSPTDVQTYDLKPEMSSVELTEIVVNEINNQKYDFIFVNLAQPDMVAHTGKLDATVRAIESADEAIGKIVSSALAKDGKVIITSDHGNCEELINLETGEADTEHSANQVPFLYVSNNSSTLPRELLVGSLVDIAPTVLGLLGLKPSNDMTGKNLLATVL